MTIISQNTRIRIFFVRETGHMATLLSV